MILTRNMINQMRLYSRIDDTLEQMLLDQLGTEPYPHMYTEQDIYEQSRKMILQYNENMSKKRHKVNLAQKSPEETHEDGAGGVF